MSALRRRTGDIIPGKSTCHIESVSSNIFSETLSNLGIIYNTQIINSFAGLLVRTPQCAMFERDEKRDEKQLSLHVCVECRVSHISRVCHIVTLNRFSSPIFTLIFVNIKVIIMKQKTQKKHTNIY